MQKDIRKLVLGYMLAGALLGAGFYGLLLLALDQAERQEPARVTVQVSYGSDHWQESINDMQEACGLALDQVAASMPDEEFDSMPVEVWQSAYQLCLFNAGATI